MAPHAEHPEPDPYDRELGIEYHVPIPHDAQ